MSKVKFIHIADMHLDAWREKKLKVLNFKAFKKVVDESIKNNVDFVLMSGDILHVSLPSLSAIKLLTKYLKRLKDHNIKVFAIPGSHDLSSDENSILYVLEEADLLTITSNGEEKDGKIVLLPTEHKDVVIYGMLGRRLGLDKEYYKKIVSLKNFEKYKDKYKIFQFHIGINEILPNDLKMPQNISLNHLPKGFHYYAGGHIHLPLIKKINDLKSMESYVVYPGPLYPDKFDELEDLKGTSYYVYVEAERNHNGEWITQVQQKTFNLYNIEVVKVNCDGLTPPQIEEKTLSLLKERDIKDKILLMKFYGNVEGLVSQINFKRIESFCESHSPYIIKKNTFHLNSKMYEPEIMPTSEGKQNIEEIEQELIKKFFSNIKEYSFDTYNISNILIQKLSEPKNENETQQNYSERVVDSCIKSIFQTFKNKTLFEERE